MPHAERDTMGEPTVNGEKPASQFLSHLTSYPVVSDSITTFKNNKYGAKSLTYADQGYAFAKPYLPYLSAPYSYVAPYVAKADSLGDQGLTHVDERFPIVKEDTDKIRGTLVDTAYFPVRVAEDARQHLLDTYGAEYKKCGGAGYVASGKAVVTTSLVLSQESLGWLSTAIAAQKEQAKEVVNEKVNH
ncbi:uncharacterized protein TRUGW13939_04451 [Talaromyces rugulosus]|uniref:Pathogenesis associated protein Cap20 n=1 Tax=Talaromyces rugulosus TaxID=121627 RepID=A0A7H8QTR3_TALRU|nr:uncharacterized protein TRUGW13939_04451 [Talaromyces rugulosus]QKX57339.1 hypothetical protein TRUGW13939_04451 [Talaromyces rugulosus]